MHAKVGSRIGRYVLVEPLGAGGMGVVYRAYDPKLRREIALKHIGARALALHVSVERTLVREARAMAQLRHRNVVSIFDVEVSSGDFFLAMELVPGPDARVWLQTPRRPNEILEVFIDAGRGLACAHAAGLVHRDFKPANVLVDPDLGARVSDFGLAKLVGPVESEVEPSTDPESDPDDCGEVVTLAPTLDPGGRTHSRVALGTPRYMAPEQHTGLRVDARADQFAFCVALWEALTGAPPYRGTNKDLARAKRLGPPAWPKTRGVAPRVVAALRRGLSPTADARWPSMDALLRQLQPRRTRARGWAAGIVALAGLGIIVGRPADAATRPCSGADALMAQTWNGDARRAVEEVFDASEYGAPVLAVTLTRFDGFADAWSDAHRATCEATAIRGEQSERVLDLRMTCLHERRRAFGEVIDVLTTSGKSSTARVHRLLGQLPELEGCADGEALAEVTGPEDPEVAQTVAQLDRELDGLRLRSVVGYEDHLRACEILDRAVGLEWKPLEAKARMFLSLVMSRHDKSQEAAEHAERAWRLALQSDRPLIAARSASIAGQLFSETDPDSGARLARAGLDLAVGRNLPTKVIASAHANLGNALLNGGELDGAERHLRESVELHSSRDFPGYDLAASLTDLARVVHRQGRHDEALGLMERAVSVATAYLGGAHPEVLSLRMTRAGALAGVGRTEEAIEEQQTLLVAAERSLGPADPEVGRFASQLAMLLAADLRSEEAEVAARKAIEISTAHFGELHGDVAVARSALGRALFHQARNEEAADEQRRALEIELLRLGPAHGHVAHLRRELAETLAFLGRPADALEELDLAKPHVDPDAVPEQHVAVQVTRAHCLKDLHRNLEARAAASDAWALADAPGRNVRLIVATADIYAELLEDEAPAAAAGVRTAAAARCLARGVACRPPGWGQ